MVLSTSVCGAKITELPTAKALRVVCLAPSLEHELLFVGGLHHLAWGLLEWVTAVECSR